MFYISNFGPWWFMERYLAPVLLLAIPWLATALELRRPSPRALPALAAIVIAANVPVLAVLASGTGSPPAWAARDSNLGAHPNLNVTEQLAWIDDHVSPKLRRRRLRDRHAPATSATARSTSTARSTTTRSRRGWTAAVPTTSTRAAST